MGSQKYAHELIGQEIGHYMLDERADWLAGLNSELRTQKLFVRPYTHLQNKVQCMNNNVYIMYIWVKETPTSTGATPDYAKLI